MIDWKNRYRELEEQMRIMLLQVANRYEELEIAANLASEPTIRDLRTSRSKSGIEAVVQANGQNLEFAFAIYGPNGFKQVLQYSPKNNANFAIKTNGKFRVWVHAREIANQNKILTKKSPEIEITGR